MKMIPGTGFVWIRKETYTGTGKFSGTAQFDQFSLKSNGSEDMVILKCDPDGNIQWIRQAGGNSIEKSSDNVSGITINNNKLVITGFFSGIIQFGNQTLNSAGREDIFVLFLDTQGHILKPGARIMCFKKNSTRCQKQRVPPKKTNLCNPIIPLNL
ncbi:MAG: hypothetical protein R2778_03840 [Saprospiraceae bacterium]